MVDERGKLLVKVTKCSEPTGLKSCNQD